MNQKTRRSVAAPVALTDARRIISDPDAARAASESQRRLAWLVASSAAGRAPRQLRPILGQGVTFEEAHDFRATESDIHRRLADSAAKGSALVNLSIAGVFLGVIFVLMLWFWTATASHIPARCVVAPTSCQTFEDSLAQRVGL
ncbi:hypothetical protein PE067_10555 [Paracoccus sp. DMF-8]|uniref:hypothetical protein n=1 Tax=Paracoccus sp. DMF-8 TaxID=3019445 RepID=UPI0023E8CCE7|nr:hypothetical protein [Paracoccus sp. DMF-8]MDF3606541.1 hypothetical protein [Paracoccus sp. DMF-8]